MSLQESEDGTRSREEMVKSKEIGEKGEKGEGMETELICWGDKEKQEKRSRKKQAKIAD